MDKKELVFLRGHFAELSQAVLRKLKADIIAERRLETVNSAADKGLGDRLTGQPVISSRSETYVGMCVGSCLPQCTESHRGLGLVRLGLFDGTCHLAPGARANIRSRVPASDRPVEVSLRPRRG
ncbi:hypothetical protein L798_02757 [Zootermopsis nevadensis]|uniref:Uncharacterized protein n=1 Tax=Zootermopsis nevadensis TaxID=136037 RepID=A0A067QRH0_ZOONE|nr:hypothetical protein L798_02757 [Zootermopsis nevadensis]